MQRRGFASKIGYAITLLGVLTLAGRVNAQQTDEQAPPALGPQLDSMEARFARRAPQEKIDLYEGAIDDLRDSGILERALNVGDTVPDFALPGANGDTLALRSFLARGPVVIIWYRGGWCPYCNTSLHAWMQWAPQAANLGAQLIAISPEIPDSSLSTKQKHELPFAVLSDRGNEVARQFGIVFTLPPVIVDAYSQFFSLAAYNGDEKNELPLAATYVIDPNGVIRYAFLDADYKERAEPSEVIAVLKGMAGK